MSTSNEREVQDGAVLVTPSWIAQTAVVQPSTVSNWRKRDPGFPPPAGGTESRPLFDREEVLEWARRTGRFDPNLATRGKSHDQLAMAILNTMRGVAAPREYLDLAVVVFARLAIARGEDDRLMDLTTFAGISERDIDGIAREALQIIGSESLTSVFESIVDYTATKGLTREAHLTPKPLARFMARQLGRSEKAIDPAAGMGTLLLAGAERAGARHVLGYDVNTQSLSVLRVRALLAGIAVDAVTRDVVYDPILPPEKANAVVLDAPFGLKVDRSRLLDRDPRFLASRGGTGDAIWLLIAASHLGADGTAVVHLPSTVATSQRDAAIREELIMSGALRAIVSVDVTGPTFRSAIATDVWVLGPATTAPSVNVRFVNARSIDINHAAESLGAVLEASTDMAIHNGASVADVSRLELIRSGSELAPLRWTATQYEASDAKAGLKQAGEELRTLRQDMDGLLLKIPEMQLKAAESQASSVTMRELRDRKLARRVRSLPITRNDARSMAVGDEDSIPIVFAPGFNGVPSAGDADRIPREVVREYLQRGDIVYIEIGEKPRVRVWDTDEEWALGRGLGAYRLETDEFVPGYVAAVLASTLASAYGSGGTIPRRNFDAVPIPRLARADQERIAVALDSLEGAEIELKRLAAQMATVRRNITDAVAAGFATIADPTDPNEPRKARA